jgi:gamma-glutamyltranspeptidase/glutathione hydrolase
MSASARALVIMTAVTSAGVFALPDTAPPVIDPEHYVECHNGVVVSISGPASDVGVTILRQGGNAVDAAVATAFALAVAYPAAGNLGGGGFMVIHPAPGDGEPVAINYRECAAAAATPTMFARGESQYSRKAVAVPGTVRGLALAHRRFGSLPWSDLIRPAIALARGGFPLDRNIVDSLNDTLAAAGEFAEFQRVFRKPGGGTWAVGNRLTQPDLARTLEVLADRGPDAFYAGPIAAEIIAEMGRGNGLITATDLANYRAIDEPPLTTRYRDRYDVYVPPPPSSGGTCLIEELHMLEAFDLPAWGWRTPTTIHVMAEVMRRATYDRARYLGDPAYVSIPPKLTDRAYGRELARTIDLHHATRSADLATDIPISREGQSTTHFSVIDRRGMAVANTYTLERRWGSRVVVRGTGLLLNNDMYAFNHFPGVTNTAGAIGTPPNTIAPGKRPLSSMTPTIVARNGSVVLVTGSPGSRSIPHTVLEILVGVFDFGEPVRTAVAAPRFTQEWFPDNIMMDWPERYPDTVRALRERGHVIVGTGPLPQGDAHTIWVAGPGRYVGVADTRLNGHAAGYR